MKYDIKKLIAITAVVLLSMCWNVPTALADPSTPPSPDYDPDNEVPIDGGAGLLIAAGVAYGLKKVHDHKKRKESGLE